MVDHNLQIVHLPVHGHNVAIIDNVAHNKTYYATVEKDMCTNAFDVWSQNYNGCNYLIHAGI